MRKLSTIISILIITFTEVLLHFEFVRNITHATRIYSLRGIRMYNLIFFSSEVLLNWLELCLRGALLGISL